MPLWTVHMVPCESSRLVQKQCPDWFLSTLSLFFWKTIHTRPRRGCFGVTESLLKRLSCLQSHYAGLIRARHYVVMSQRSCCSMLPPPLHQPSASHPTLLSLCLCFSELGAVQCCGHALLNNCDSHLSGIRLRFGGARVPSG